MHLVDGHLSSSLTPNQTLREGALIIYLEWIKLPTRSSSSFFLFAPCPYRHNKSPATLSYHCQIFMNNENVSEMSSIGKHITAAHHIIKCVSTMKSRYFYVIL